MQISAQELAKLLDGTIEGDPTTLVSQPSKIEEGKLGTISFLANPKYESFAYTTQASILLVSNDFQPSKPIESTLIRVDDVYASIAFLLNHFGQASTSSASGISEKSSIDDSAQLGEQTSIGDFTVIEEGVTIGENCKIGPQVFIGQKAQIGKNVVLHPGVKIMHQCIIGDNCVLHPNVVVGADGFGFAPQEDGTYKKIAQIGNVIIEHDVEIGANTTIDRATMGSTIIHAGAKLDNLVMIAHNVEVGKNTVMAAQSGIAGSTKVGNNVLIGGQAGLVGHLKIADGAKIQAQSGVTKSIRKENYAVYGYPAIEYSNYLRSFASFKNLPELVKKVHELEKKLTELQGTPHK